MQCKCFHWCHLRHSRFTKFELTFDPVFSLSHHHSLYRILPRRVASRTSWVTDCMVSHAISLNKLRNKDGIRSAAHEHPQHEHRHAARATGSFLTACHRWVCLGVTSLSRYRPVHCLVAVQEPIRWLLSLHSLPLHEHTNLWAAGCSLPLTSSVSFPLTRQLPAALSARDLTPCKVRVSPLPLVWHLTIWWISARLWKIVRHGRIRYKLSLLQGTASHHGISPVTICPIPFPLPPLSFSKTSICTISTEVSRCHSYSTSIYV